MSPDLSRRLDLLERALISLAAIAIPADGRGMSADELQCIENLRATLEELEELHHQEVEEC